MESKLGNQSLLEVNCSRLLLFKKLTFQVSPGHIPPLEVEHSVTVRSEDLSLDQETDTAPSISQSTERDLGMFLND